jgi:hypothetical protein
MKITRATLCFLIKDGTVLLALKKRGFGKDFWNGVGGKIEPGETPKQKVARIDFYFPKSNDKDPWVERVFVFLTDSWLGQPAETEEMKPKWFKFGEIPYKKMWSDDILWIPKVLNGQKIKAHFWFDEQNQVKKHKILYID